MPNEADDKFNLPALTAGTQNQGLNNFVPREGATILNNKITISANGTGIAFYQSKEFTILQDAYALDWIHDKTQLTDNQYLFMVSTINKCIYGNYKWEYKSSWERIKAEYIKLPIKNGKIDFDFMESFIAELETQRITELETYLVIAGFKDYILTSEEMAALERIKIAKWQSFNLKELFGNATRGKRLKSDDWIAGDLPFVTAGEGNTGISAFIGNEVNRFSANTTTIDMFGSAKYRNYEYGADDHIAVVHTEGLSKMVAIFITASINKASNNGQFDYSRNFYAKDADDLNIMLPVENNKIDYKIMELYISAVHKLVIKCVVEYADRKISLTRKCVAR